MKRVAIIQARMGSSRLPGKILEDLNGKPVLVRMLAQLRRCDRIDELCIATTTQPGDDAIVELAATEHVTCFRGSETDVLARYAGAARATGAELVVRLTSDCPLIAPEVVDQVIARATKPDAACDYVSNTTTRRYPRGLETEVLYADTLARVDRLARSRAAREHVTYFITTEQPQLFVCRDVVAPTDDSDLRWTVDTPEDLAMIRALHAAAGLTTQHMTAVELIAIARAHPEITALNAGIAQKQP